MYCLLSHSYFKLVATVSIVTILFIYANTSNMSAKKLVSVEYEIYGRVQGVFFRKHTQKESQKLGLKGWCMNTEKGTVQGVMEGYESKVIEMKNWLKKVGSPTSRIDKAEFTNEKPIPQFTYSNFSIKR